MRSATRRPVSNLTYLLLVCVVLAGACATTSVPSVPTGPDQLQGARYKLVVGPTGMDHRVVEFKVNGRSARGYIVDKGRVLSQQVGVPDNFEAFSLTQVEGGPPNQYEGIYRTIGSDGRQSEREVTVEFFSDKLTWTLESVSWERIN